MRCIVSGNVQGVFFRASTQSQARALALTGYARNQADGTVEVLACGDMQALTQLQAWLWQGPPAARVDHVVCTSVEQTAPAEFAIH
ncbi:MAG: acylphosphatase [Gammaproteobacteria bacterium]